MTILLMHDRDTNIFAERSGDEILFWRAVSDLTKVLELMRDKEEPVRESREVLMVLCHEADQGCSVVKYAKSKSSFVSLQGLQGESINEYVCTYLQVEAAVVPSNLRRFIARLTLGNPLFVRETIDNLLEQGLLQVLPETRTLLHVPLSTINISSWHHTAMVGGTTCLLESLDPLEAAVVKMSTCFGGPFTVADLSASTCSRKADARFFDLLRLYSAIQKLVKMSIIQRVGPPEERIYPVRPEFGETQFFHTKNQLVRAVGGSMLLDSQKLCVKRQALIGRALSKEQSRRPSGRSYEKAQHIPWYYEQAYRRTDRKSVV